jgi:hypothetical protein
MRDRLRQRIRKLARVKRKVASRPERVETCGGHGPVTVEVGQAILRRRGRQTTVVEHATNRCSAGSRPGPLLARERIAHVAARRVAILSKHGALVSEHSILKCGRVNVACHGRRRKAVWGALVGTEHGVEVVVGQRQRVHGAGGWRLGLAVAAVATLGQCRERRVTVQGVRTRNLVGRTRDVSGVIVAVAWLVVAVREDRQMTFGVRGHELGFRARIVERLLAGIELEINALLDGSTEALPAGMALAAIVMD